MGIQKYTTTCAHRIGTTEAICATGDSRIEIVLFTDHEAEVATLREALKRVRFGVMLMVPEPQKSGFLEIIDAALAQKGEKDGKKVY